MIKAGKVWGETNLIHANGVLEFHRITAKKGTMCSKHLHRHKWNGFYVERGHLLIRVWQDAYDLVDKTDLKAGDFCQVKPGLMHSFEAVKDTIAFELYWAEFAHDDIDRETVGGIVEEPKVAWYEGITKGDKVHYQPAHYLEKDEWENGIVKEVRPNVKDAVWVVYNCGGEWAHYEEYTSAKTNLRDLKPGWRTK